MSNANTNTEVEVLEDTLIFYINYDEPEDLDEDGDGDWGHVAHIVAEVATSKVRVVDGDIVIKDVKSFSVSDGSYTNSVTGESESEDAESFEKIEVLEILNSTLSEDSKEYLLEYLNAL